MPPPKKSFSDRHVFLDAQVFFQQHWDFSNAQFRALVNHAKQLRIASLTTDVTYREIEAHLSEQATKIAAALKELRRLARVVPADKIPFALNEEWPEESIRKALSDQLEGFFTETKGTKLSLQEVDLAEVVDAYFRGTPPFGPGRKRDEFPDAIALAAIRKHVAMTNDTFMIVTADKPFGEAASKLPRTTVLTSLTECLTQLSNEVEIEKALTTTLTQQFDKHQEQFLDIVNRADFWESRLGATVGETDQPKIVGHDIFVTELTDGFASLAVDLHCDVWMRFTFKGEIPIRDPDGMMWLPQDMRASGMQRVTVPVEVIATFEPGQPTAATFHVQGVGVSETVEFEASEDLTWT